MEAMNKIKSDGSSSTHLIDKDWIQADQHFMGQGGQNFTNEEQEHATAHFKQHLFSAQRQALQPHTLSEMSISPYPAGIKHEEFADEEVTNEDIIDNYVEKLDEIYSPGQLYPAESTFDAAEYTENRTQFAPRQQLHSEIREEGHLSNNGNAEYSNIVAQEVAFSEDHDDRKLQPRFLNSKHQPQQHYSPNTSMQSLQVHPQNSQSSLMRQFSEKIKSQAERLQKLEAYKKLCERRILDFDPQHALPITQEMLGQPCDITRDSAANKGQQTDLKRQLALKEQDLVYAKQRAEKALKENEYLQKEISEIKMRQIPPVEGDHQLRDQLKTLEEEKNALLDYIEESVNITADNSAILQKSAEKDKQPANEFQQQHRLTLNDMQSQIKRLQGEKIDLCRQNEDLHKKIAQIESHNQPNLASSRREETFGNLPTALSTRTAGPIFSTKEQRLSDPSLTQVQSIDYMVLDLNAAKQELMETQNQFSMTQNKLNATKQENEDLQERLEEALSRIVDLEQQLMVMPKSQNTASIQQMQSPWQGTAKSTLSVDLQSDEPDREYKIKLVEERDRLLDQKSELSEQLRLQMEENNVLKTTLDETQHELEKLINEHERVRCQINDQQHQLRDAQDLPRRLRQEAQGIKDQLQERIGEVAMLQGEIKTLSEQAETNLETLKQLRAQNLKLEAQIIESRDCDEKKVQSHRMQWEMTMEDLNRELKEAQATIVQKDTIFQKIERELRNKLHEVEDANWQKSNMVRRIEDLNHEVRQLQALQERRESDMKEQQRQSEELKFELERVQLQFQKANHERKQSQDLRKEDCGVIEATQTKVERQGKVINKICRDVGKVQELIVSIQKEFNLPNRLQAPPAEPTQGQRQSQLEEQLRSVNGFLKQIGEWLVSFAKAFKHSQKSLEMAQNEAENANRQTKVLEQRFLSTQQEGFEAQELGRHLTIELETLKGEIADTQTLQRDGFEREERIHKRNQQLKNQVEATIIQKEKLSLQYKTILGEKEQLKDQIDQKIQETEEIDERSKMYELQVSQLIEQKQSVLELFTRFKDAFPSTSLREVFEQIIQVVKKGHEIDQQFFETENELLLKEGQLRKYAKREVEGLLSTKVINIRKEVEQGRTSLREMNQTREDLEVRLNELEHELKQNESIERRRGDVALETEQSLTIARQELQDVRRELIFTQRNRNDLEVALKASQQEREMISRELMTLRHQLQLKAELDPNKDFSKISRDGTLSTARKVTSYNATHPSFQTVPPNGSASYRTFSADRLAPQPSHALRHGEPQPISNFIAPVQHGQPNMYEAEECWDKDLQGRQMPLKDPTRNVNPSELPLKRRFPSQEPALYSKDNNNDRNVGPMNQTFHHQPMRSDMPLQMPQNLTERETEKARASMYGGILSGPGALVTTVGSIHDNFRPPISARQTADQNSTRPPTYQTTQRTQSASKNAAYNNTIIASFNPLPQPGMQQVAQGNPQQLENQYMTGKFAKEFGIEQQSSSNELTKTIQEPSIQSMRFQNQNNRANSQANLYFGSIQNQNFPPNHQKSSQVNSGEPLQPIMSQYGGEITSHSSRKSPTNSNALNQNRLHQLLGGTDRSRESPLRSSRVPAVDPKANQDLNTAGMIHPQIGSCEEKMSTQIAKHNNTSLGCEDSKLDAQAYAQQNQSTQKSMSAYAAHRSSINESSIHNKLSALRNVFTQIRQNLDESSMTGHRTGGPHSSMDQSVSHTNDFC